MTPSFKSPVRNHQCPLSPFCQSLCQIMSNFDQTFKICPFETSNIIFDVQLNPIILFSSQEPSISSKPEAPISSKFIMKLLSLKLCTFFRICPSAITNIIFYIQLYPIILNSSQETSTSSKPPCNQKLFISLSLDDLSLFILSFASDKFRFLIMVSLCSFIQVDPLQP